MSISRKEIRALLKQHNALLAGLHAARQDWQDSYAAVREAADRLCAETADSELQQIPAEELGRKKAGLKIKPLSDQGICTLADVLHTSAASLEAIPGISQEGAEILRSLAEEYRQELTETVKIRLSADSRTPASTDLVLAVSHFRQRVPYWQEAQKLLQLEPQISAQTALLSPAAGLFSRLFLSGQKKQQAEQAFSQLKNAACGEYGQSAGQVLSALRAIPAETPRSAWEDFSAHSIEFYGVLEQLVPERMADTHSVYGMPEQLAQQIQSQSPALDGLKCTLRGYQLWGVKYILSQKRVLLGDEMGLGKTVQAIGAMTALRNQGGHHFLVVCPASVLTNWCREIRKFSDLPVTEIHGSDRMEELEQWLKQGGAAVTTYETTGRITLPEDFRISMLVADEAHYLKNPKAQRTVNTSALCKKSDSLLFMTGTALENRVDEMISLLEILNPEAAGEAKSRAFMASAPQFRELVAPVYCRRKRDDVLSELPELIDTQQWCSLSKPEKQRYESAVLSHQFNDARRVSWHMDDVQQSSKAERLLELCEKAEDDQRKIIVFSFFLDTLSKVCAVLGEKCMPPITGSVPIRQRQEIIDNFQTAPAGTVLPAQIISGGTGLNIQSASVVILCEPQLKPSTENQAISRAYRMGQSRNVLVYRLLADDTIDERITDLLEEKQKVFDAFADESEAGDQMLELDSSALSGLMEQEEAKIQASR